MLNRIFVIEDEFHAEIRGQFSSFNEALSQIKDYLNASWESNVNRPPCEDWRNCIRQYSIIEYDNIREPWQVIKRVEILTMTAQEVHWIYKDK